MQILLTYQQQSLLKSRRSTGRGGGRKRIRINLPTKCNKSRPSRRFFASAHKRPSLIIYSLLLPS
ncbi:hypothetical protein RSAG8_05277, partial [Rhizoctonia solani AG-8 WAC10335]